MRFCTSCGQPANAETGPCAGCAGPAGEAAAANAASSGLLAAPVVTDSLTQTPGPAPAGGSGSAGAGTSGPSLPQAAGPVGAGTSGPSPTQASGPPAAETSGPAPAGGSGQARTTGPHASLRTFGLPAPGPADGPALPGPWPPRRTAVAPGRASRDRPSSPPRPSRASRDRPSSPPRPGRPAKPSAADPAGTRQHARGAALVAPRRDGGCPAGVAAPVQAGGSRGHDPHAGGRRRDRHRVVGPERTAPGQPAGAQPDHGRPRARAGGGRGSGSRHHAGVRPVAYTARRVSLRPRVLAGTHVHASITRITRAHRPAPRPPAHGREARATGREARSGRRSCRSSASTSA